MKDTTIRVPKSRRIVLKKQINVNFVKVALSQTILETFYVSNIYIPNHYPEQKIWISCLLIGGKFKFSAQVSDLEYLFWQC